MRQERFARQIQKDLGEILSNHRSEWLTGAFVTISKVVVSPDLGYLKVYLSLFNNKNRQDILDHLNGPVNKEVRHELAIKIRNNVRKIPEIRFYEDDTLDYVEKMDELFRKINE
jgi:ribosome-binding factor A